jgi:CRISPR-associated protein Cas1
MPILDISSKKVDLHLKKGFLQLTCNDKQKEIPLHIIDAIVVFAYSCNYSQQLLQKLCDENIPLIICDKKSQPIGIFQSTKQNVLRKQRVENQLNLKQSKINLLWQQIIKQKTYNQAQLLRLLDKENSDILNYNQHIKLNDSSNIEALVAQLYWKRLFGRQFKRDPDISGINSLLNYGYIVVRSVFCRVITASGLVPEIGLHHKNLYNPFCLSDDLIEPYRPYVDKIVFEIYDFDKDPDLTPEYKKRIVGVLDKQVNINNKNMHLQFAIQYTVESLISVYENNQNNLFLPNLL